MKYKILSLRSSIRLICIFEFPPKHYELSYFWYYKRKVSSIGATFTSLKSLPWLDLFPLAKLQNIVDSYSSVSPRLSSISMWCGITLIHLWRKKLTIILFLQILLTT